MRKPRPATFNPAQALHPIAKDRSGSALSCPSCSGEITRHPDQFPPREVNYSPNIRLRTLCVICCTRSSTRPERAPVG